MVTETLPVGVDARTQAFELLKRVGPLCASQIAVELRLPLRHVGEALEALRSEGLVEPRPDHDESMHYDENETPWGLSRPRWVRRAH